MNYLLRTIYRVNSTLIAWPYRFLILNHEFNGYRKLKTGLFSSKKIIDCTITIESFGQKEGYKNSFFEIESSDIVQPFKYRPDAFIKNILKSNPDCNAGNCYFSLHNVLSYQNYSIDYMEGEIVDYVIRFTNITTHTRTHPIDFLPMMGKMGGGKIRTHKCQDGYLKK